MGLHLRHNFVRVSATYNQPSVGNLTIRGQLGFLQLQQLERMLRGTTTISQRCTVCDKRRVIIRSGDLTAIE